MPIIPTPEGDKAREAIDALKGYVYQIYQSALAWTELEAEEFLFLEVAEDYAVIAGDALNAVQVKETAHNVTINSNDIIASIDSFVELRLKNPELQVRLRHLTTSKIAKEKSAAHRIGDKPTLETWRTLAKTGDLIPLRKILDASKLSKQTKNYIRALDDTEFREEFLKRIHFDCGALDSRFLERQIRSKLSKLVVKRGGVDSQVDSCLSSILVTLLRKATQTKDRFVDRNMLEELLEKATQITINRAQFDAQSHLINKALAASVPPGMNLVERRIAEPRPIDEVPLPRAIADRSIQIENIVSSLTRHGVSWVFGAAGVGKTTGARIAARRIGGMWGSVNLRGLNVGQVDTELSAVIDRLTEYKIDGFLIDDLECQFEPRIVDKLLYLRFICDRSDLLLFFTSPIAPSPDFLFSANLPASITQKFEEFSESDIEQILAGLSVHDRKWAKYIYLVSGGGHPQLAIAAIQSMQNNDWDASELKTLNSLLVGNAAVEQVRARTRERLLNELPEGGRRLLERLSLKAGSFRRSFVLDMAQVRPVVADGGFVFDRLIGSWVDQQEQDRFALSPLLSNLAFNTLTDEDKRDLYFKIADSLTKGRSLDPVEANSVLLAAWSGKNARVISRVCLALLGAEQKDLEMIAPHLMIFTHMRTDTSAYEEEPAVSQMFRGVQLLLICCDEEGKEKAQEVLDRFEAESGRVENAAMRTTMTIFVYEKLLLSTPKFGALPNFWDLIRKLATLLKWNKNLPPELSEQVGRREIEGVPVLGLMFLTQMRQIKGINELLPAFEFVDSCGKELREELLRLYENPVFDVDMLVSAAWLSEHQANTMDPPSHSDVFLRLEQFAESWGYADLAVCCRKYRAIIVDEYGGDKDLALAILDEGLEHYGENNSELVRAKAKVLYRAEDLQGSLELSKRLIEGNAALSETDKAFLGRDSAISAEKEGEYEIARRYYLYGSNAARKCGIPDMVPMRIGLMADAALASWHAGDRATCLRDFIAVLHEIEEIDAKSSLRAAHCHATCRHVLLWLQQEASGAKRLLSNGEETGIYPGVVSNPAPHSEIGDQYITPIDMAWYMLASVENYCSLDLGITRNLGTVLSRGPVFEGDVLLTAAKMTKAFMALDAHLFVTALCETVAAYAYAKDRGGDKNILNFRDVTYGTIPVPSLDQQYDSLDGTEPYVLCFIAKCIFDGNTENLEQLIDVLEESQGFKVRKELLNALAGSGHATDFNIAMAALLAAHWNAIHKREVTLPSQVFELVFQVIQVASNMDTISNVMVKSAFDWLSAKWVFISEQQRFLLRRPVLCENQISQASAPESDSWMTKVIQLLQEMLPTIGFKHESEYRRILNKLQETKD